MTEIKMTARPWTPQDLLDDLQDIINEEPDNYLNTRRTTMEMALAYLKEHFYGWIPVSERLPEEHESIFKKFYGTNKWTSAMFQTISDNVLAVVSHKDGSKTVKTMCTLDGEWRIADGRPWNITHWMPLPNPPEEEKNNG